jgi:hypothetical protein
MGGAAPAADGAEGSVVAVEEVSEASVAASPAAVVRVEVGELVSEFCNRLGVDFGALDLHNYVSYHLR